jgi:hypothetical protein
MPKKPPPNPLELAIFAAGGAATIAEHYGISEWAVRKWVAEERMPGEKIGEICAMGRGVVAPATLTEYLAERAAARARAKVLARAA